MCLSIYFCHGCSLIVSVSLCGIFLCHVCLCLSWRHLRSVYLSLTFFIVDPLLLYLCKYEEYWSSIHLCTFDVLFLMDISLYFSLNHKCLLLDIHCVSVYYQYFTVSLFIIWISCIPLQSLCIFWICYIPLYLVDICICCILWIFYTLYLMDILYFVSYGYFIFCIIYPILW